jgi:hypothetical protein
VVELRLNGKPFQPNFFTGLKKNYEIKEKIIIPVKYCDLALVSLVGITIYDMKR